MACGYGRQITVDNGWVEGLIMIKINAGDGIKAAERGGRGERGEER